MENTQKLKNGRNTLLKLHKSLIDHEREMYEGVHGKLTAGGFLNVLIDDEDFAWLRKFSMLIVEVDEMFALKDGINAEMINASLAKLVELVEMKEADEYFKAKYQFSLQRYPDVAEYHLELTQILS